MAEYLLARTARFLKSIRENREPAVVQRAGRQVTFRQQAGYVRPGSVPSQREGGIALSIAGQPVGEALASLNRSAALLIG
jgi:hypothetical protein